MRERLEAAGCLTEQATGDADLLIVQRSVERARSSTTVLVGDDTDLLVLLLYHADITCKDIFFCPEPKQNSKKQRIWNINKTKSDLGDKVCKNILFIHALLGCDTTSRLYGIGKGVALQKISNAQFSQQADVFSQSDPDEMEEIITAGEKALVCLYNGTLEDSLDSLWYKKFCNKVASSTTPVQACSLPPTTCAAKYHTLRVYHQIQVWKGVLGLHPDRWGWRQRGDKLEAITTDEAAAPTYLLEIIRCHCKTDCVSTNCSCKKHGLKCSTACKECRRQMKL